MILIEFNIATKLAKYLIETKTIALIKGNQTKAANCSILEFKIRKFAGRYDKILDKHIELVLFDF
jgi:hypothetical protein